MEGAELSLTNLTPVPKALRDGVKDYKTTRNISQNVYPIMRRLFSKAIHHQITDCVFFFIYKLVEITNIRE